MQTQPSNLNSEAMALGSVIFDARTLSRLDRLTADHFYSETNAAIWSAIKGISAKGMVPNEDAVIEWFSGSAVPGGVDYLANLVDAAGFGQDINDAGKMIIDAYHRRQMLEIAEALRAEAIGAGDGYIEPGKLLSAHDGRLDDIRKEMTGDLPHHDFNTAGMESIDLTQQVAGRRIKTGFADLDERTGGLEEGTVTILAAGTSMGKSTLAVCIGVNAMKAGHTVGYFTLEMSRHSMAQRGGAYLLYDKTSNSNLHYADVMNGKASPADITRMTRVFEEQAHNRLFLDDRGELTTASMSERLRGWEAMARRRGLPMPKLIVIDHMGNMRPQKSRRDAFQDVSAVSKEVLAFAKRHSVAVLALNQINRNSVREERRPALHDLRQSGEIEEDAHAVIFLHREEHYAKKEMDAAKDMDAYNKASERWMASRGHAEIIIAKNRNGPLDTIRLRCDMASNAFYDPQNNVTNIWEASS
jgi:replicative DNA helicase